MYTGLASIRIGLSKNMLSILEIKGLFEVLAQSLKALLLGPASPALITLAGLAYKHSGDVFHLAAFIVSLATAFISFIVFLKLILYFKVSPLYTLFFPAGFVFVVILMLIAYKNEITGRKVWKDRDYFFTA